MTTKNLQNHFFYAFWPYVTSQKKKASPHPSTHKTDKNGPNNVIGHLNLTSWVNHYNWSIEKSFPLLVFLQSTANMVIKADLHYLCMILIQNILEEDTFLLPLGMLERYHCNWDLPKIPEIWDHHCTCQGEKQHPSHQNNPFGRNIISGQSAGQRSVANLCMEGAVQNLPTSARKPV